MAELAVATGKSDTQGTKFMPTALQSHCKEREPEDRELAFLLRCDLPKSQFPDYVEVTGSFLSSRLIRN